MGFTMARKRLLTILAGAVAVIGLQVGSATALEVEADLGDTKVEASVSEDGVDTDVAEDEDDDAGVKVSSDSSTAGDDGDAEVEAEVSDDGVDAKVGDTEVSTDEATSGVEEPVDDPEPTAGDDGDEQDSSEPEDSGSASYEITTAGDAQSTRDRSQRPAALDPAQARRFVPGYEYSDGSGGGISPAFGFSASDGDAFDDPLVADAPSQGNAWASVSPEEERSDAELAAIPATGDGDAVPTGLKLLAGLLVAGTGTLWHLTRRELAPVTTGLRLG